MALDHKAGIKSGIDRGLLVVFLIWLTALILLIALLIVRNIRKGANVRTTITIAQVMSMSESDHPYIPFPGSRTLVVE